MKVRKQLSVEASLLQLASAATLRTAAGMVRFKSRKKLKEQNKGPDLAKPDTKDELETKQDKLRRNLLFLLLGAIYGLRKVGQWLGNEYVLLPMLVCVALFFYLSYGMFRFRWLELTILVAGVAIEFGYAYHLAGRRTVELHKALELASLTAAFSALVWVGMQYGMKSQAIEHNAKRLAITFGFTCAVVAGSVVLLRAISG